MAEHTTGKGGKDPAEQPGKINMENTNNGNKALKSFADTIPDKTSANQANQQKNKWHSIARGSGAEHSDWIKRGRSWAVPIAELIFLVGLVIAVKDGQLTVMKALPLWILGGATLAFLIQLYFSIQDQNGFRFEFFSGGLEGSLGGWEMSRSLAYVFLVAAFGAVFLVMTDKLDGQNNNSGQQGEDNMEQTDPPSPATDNSNPEKPE